MSLPYLEMQAFKCFSSPKCRQDRETELARTRSDECSKYVRIFNDVSRSSRSKKSIQAFMSSNYYKRYATPRDFKTWVGIVRDIWSDITVKSWKNHTKEIPPRPKKNKIKWQSKCNWIWVPLPKPTKLHCKPLSIW